MDREAMAAESMTTVSRRRHTPIPLANVSDAILLRAACMALRKNCGGLRDE